MIQTLFIQNLILIEQARIEFGPGLNILTGETGAGKSAILAAIRLLLGERADTQLIRKDAELAIVEATLPSLTIRRELHRSGRSRCFVQDALVSLQELRALLCHSIELVDQSSSLQLASPDFQRTALDTYANAAETAAQLEHKFSALANAKIRLAELLHQKQSSTRKREQLQEDLAAIEETNWKSGEEEQLTAEHHLLAHAQELLGKLGNATNFLSEIIAPLKRFSHQLEQSSAIDPKLQESAQSLKTSALEIEEVNRFLTAYADAINIDPHRIHALEQRIAELEALKRRFGLSTFDALQELQKRLRTECEHIAHLDPDIERAQQEVQTLEKATCALATTLTAQRTKNAQPLARAILAELQSLNLPHARFAIEIHPKPLTSTGADQISCCFCANPNQPLLPLDQCASGGELSRLLFALKIALAMREKTTCLIFDEIDSNVGGQTAAILGAKLQTLAATRQLICVTHFVQVARCAHNHYLVTKQTATTGARKLITRLTTAAREREYARMMGEPS